MEELHSPKSNGPSQNQLLAPKPEISRSVTPDLVPDRMASRMDEGALKGLQGLIPAELPLQPMGARVAQLAV